MVQFRPVRADRRWLLSRGNGRSTIVKMRTSTDKTVLNTHDMSANRDTDVFRSMIKPVTNNGIAPLLRRSATDGVYEVDADARRSSTEATSKILQPGHVDFRSAENCVAAMPVPAHRRTPFCQCPLHWLNRYEGCGSPEGQQELRRSANNVTAQRQGYVIPQSSDRHPVSRIAAELSLTRR